MNREKIDVNALNELGYQDPRKKQLTKQQELHPCCKLTIKTHAFYNPMMLCPECKQLIKCFQDENKFRNYVIFCESRGRQINIDNFASYYVVAFRNYEPFR